VVCIILLLIGGFAWRIVAGEPALHATETTESR
jgi:hypothetical protein